MAERTQGNRAPTEPRELLVEQAVFTSVRSHLAGGYRLIAASPGINPEERAEIIRRAPSHGSLCGDGPDAVGMVAFALPTGRYCVGHVEYAGLEPSGRGGGRVYTHFAVLDDAQRDAFACNAVTIWRSLQCSLPVERILSPRTLPEPLTLVLSGPAIVEPAEELAPGPAEQMIPPVTDRLTRAGLNAVSQRSHEAESFDGEVDSTSGTEAQWSADWARMLVRLHEAVASDMAVLIEGDDGGCRMAEHLCMLAGRTRSGGLSISIGLRHCRTRRIQVTSVPICISEPAAVSEADGIVPRGFGAMSLKHLAGGPRNHDGQGCNVGDGPSQSLLVLRVPGLGKKPTPPGGTRSAARPDTCWWRRPWPRGSGDRGMR